MKSWVKAAAAIFLLTALAALQVAGQSSVGPKIGSRIVGGPFVVGATSRAATIGWLVESDEVTVQPSGNGAAPLVSPAFRVEKTTLTGLKPGTRYEYNIASAGEGGSGSFKTAPSGETGPFSFIVYGDNRTRHDVHQKVVAAVIQHGIPDFVLQTGDMVANGNDSSLWPIFFRIEKDLLSRTAFFPAMGNHERNTPYFSEFFQAPYYSFDWGSAHFSVLDSDIVNFSSDEQTRTALWNEQTEWLEEDLKRHQDAAFRFVTAHHPPITAVARRQNDNPHMIALIPLFEKYRVTAGFFGHDHNYQHYLKNGIHYVTTGGGGARLYDVDLPPKDITRKVLSIENFVSVIVDGNTASFQAIGVDGSVLDSFMIQSDGTQ